MNFKKRVNGSWTDTPHYIHNTSTDTITTPAVLYPNGTTATIGLKGQMEQTGTPTPTTPIQPQECGEKTGNLWNYGDTWENNGTDTRTFFQPDIALFDGNTKVGDNVRIDVKSNGYKYLVSITPNTSFTRVSVKHNGSTRDLPLGSVYGEFEANVPVTISFIVNGFDPTTIGGISISNIMLNTGSTALPYEPWGIKIPILSNSTITPVYLGEVESTRKIREMVLTGQETELYFNSTNKTFFFKLTGGLYSGTVRTTPLLCSHFLHLEDGRPFSEVTNNSIYIATLDSSAAAYIYSIDYADLASFKSYLAQQYAAGTPVCVWYVLAEPTTGIVNEPLRKIGDYADSVSGITIPVTAGANTLSVGTTLQPSEVSLNYKGWHPVQSVHKYDGNYTIATMQALTIVQLQTHTISDLQGGEWL